MAVSIKSRQEYTYLDNTSGVVTAQICGACATVCPWNFNEAGGNTSYSTEYLAYQRIIEHACYGSSVSFFVVYDALNTVANRFRIWANGSELYNTGCVTGSGSGYITIPAGTVSFEVRVDGACNSVAGDAWSFSGTCT